MAIIVDKDGNVVTVENEPEEARAMFPNIKEGGVDEETVKALIVSMALALGDEVGTELTNEDLNDVLTSGTYYAKSGHSLTNVPLSSEYPFKFIVLYTDDKVVAQYLLSSVSIYVRSYDTVTGVFTDWTFFLTKNYIDYYVSSDLIKKLTYNIANVSLSATIPFVANALNVIVFIPFDADLFNQSIGVVLYYKIGAYVFKTIISEYKDTEYFDITETSDNITFARKAGATKKNAKIYNLVV